MNHIEVKNLSVSFNDFCVLRNLDFEADEGDFVAIVGKSGSGKTTFLHTLAGLINFSGHINIHKPVNVVFQNYAVFPWLTVEENIAFGFKKEKEQIKEQIIEEHLKLVQLEDKKDHYPFQLSGGQIQRVSLARTLVAKPSVLLMDEPYGALDAYTRDQMQKWLLDVWQKFRKTVVFVTHNLEEAIYLADRVLVLDSGNFTHDFKIPFTRPRLEHIKFMPEFNEIRKQLYDSINHNKKS